MENTIKIKQLQIGDTTYQFKYESLNRSIEVSKKEFRRQWWSNKKKEEWKPISLDNFDLYVEVVKFQFYHANRQLIQEGLGNQSLLELIEKDNDTDNTFLKKLEDLEITRNNLNINVPAPSPVPQPLFRYAPQPTENQIDKLKNNPIILGILIGIVIGIVLTNMRPVIINPTK